MKKKKWSRAEREAYGQHLISTMIQTFADAYQERVAGNTLEGIMIRIDIEAAYNGVDPAVHLAITRAIRSAVKAVDAKIPIRGALETLNTELNDRLAETLAKK